MKSAAQTELQETKARLELCKNLLSYWLDILQKYSFRASESACWIILAKYETKVIILHCFKHFLLAFSKQNRVNFLFWKCHSKLPLDSIWERAENALTEAKLFIKLPNKLLEVEDAHPWSLIGLASWRACGYSLCPEDLDRPLYMGMWPMCSRRDGLKRFHHESCPEKKPWLTNALLSPEPGLAAGSCIWRCHPAFCGYFFLYVIVALLLL